VRAETAYTSSVVVMGCRGRIAAHVRMRLRPGKLGARRETVESDEFEARTAFCHRRSFRTCHRAHTRPPAGQKPPWARFLQSTSARRPWRRTHRVRRDPAASRKKAQEDAIAIAHQPAIFRAEGIFPRPSSRATRRSFKSRRFQQSIERLAVAGQRQRIFRLPEHFPCAGSTTCVPLPCRIRNPSSTRSAGERADRRNRTCGPPGPWPHPRRARPIDHQIEPLVVRHERCAG